MKTFDPRRLDIRRFAEEGAQLESGGESLGGYPRLLAETEGRGAGLPVKWSAQAELRNPNHVQPQVWVHVTAEATLPLTCQRCLADVDVKLHVDRDFRFVSDEETAAAEDDDAEEDVLAESRSFNLVELVEDELLMEVPVAPRHVICPVLPSFSTADPGFDAAQEKKENPFAVLQALKGSKPRP